MENAKEKKLIKITGTLVRDAAVLTIGNRVYVKLLVKIEAPHIVGVKKQIAFSFLSSVIRITSSKEASLSDINEARIDMFMLSKAGDKVMFTVYQNKHGVPEAEIQRFKNLTLDIGDSYLAAV